MQYKTLNEKNAILLADGTNAATEIHTSLPKSGGKAETTGEGLVLDLSPLVEFINLFRMNGNSLKQGRLRFLGRD